MEIAHNSLQSLMFFKTSSNAPIFKKITNKVIVSENVVYLTLVILKHNTMLSCGYRITVKINYTKLD